MIPFATQPTFQLGTHTVHAFGLLVLFAIAVGVTIARRRCVRLGLDLELGSDLMLYAVVIGIFVSHVVDVLAYHPERALANPLVLLQFWGTLSSFGGMIGGLLGMLVFFATRGAHLSRRERFAYVDTIAYGFPFAWIFGRLGCTLALDHPGKVTNGVLATSLATPEARDFLRGVYARAGNLAALPDDATLARLGFHNLGFYELIYTSLVIVPIFVVLGRKPREPGFFLALFLLVYSPVRFAMDFLRVSDRVYGGLTPGQYAAIGVTVFAAALVARMRGEQRVTAAR